MKKRVLVRMRTAAEAKNRVDWSDSEYKAGLEKTAGEVLKRLENVQREEGFVIGDITEEGAAELKARNIPVQELAAKPVYKGGRRAARSGLESTSESGSEEVEVYTIEFLTPLLESCHKELGDLKVSLLRRVPGPGSSEEAGTADQKSLPVRASKFYTARLTAEQADAISDLPYIGSVTACSEEDTFSHAKSARRGARAAAPDAGDWGFESATRSAGGLESATDDPVPEEGTYDIVLHSPEDMGSALQWLRQRGVAIQSSSGRKIQARLPADESLLQEIQRRREVEQIEEYIEPKLHADFARKLLGIDTVQAGAAAGAATVIELDQQGSGQRIGIADTGIDDTHPDLSGRIVGLIARGRPNDTSDPHGHGTHVAGCIAGNGTQSKFAIRGVAPKAELFVQSLLDAAGKVTGGLPKDLQALFDEAYRAGVRIHNNSWGMTARSRYRVSSEELDRFVDSHPDMLIVCSAGNDGSAKNPQYEDPGTVDWYPLAAPGTNKNGITVGACRSDRTSGPSAARKHNAHSSIEFPVTPIADELIAGNAEGLFGCSSRGPCQDKRIKPDVVAPGTDILSTLSSAANASALPFWGAYDAHYAYCGGTSMAAPLVSGCAALVREYYMNLPGAGTGPSAALLKATLINSTRLLTGADAKVTRPKAGTHAPEAANMHQGFGRIYMPWAIPNKVIPWLKLAFVDNWSETAKQLTVTGDSHLYRVKIGAGGTFIRFCLAYTDRAGNALQNNINLSVELPDGTRRYGNDYTYHDDPIQAAGGLGDLENNVEIVRIDNPAAGRYSVQIDAADLMDRPHSYALVITGDLEPASQGRLT